MDVTDPGSCWVIVLVHVHVQLGIPAATEYLMGRVAVRRIIHESATMVHLDILYAYTSVDSSLEGTCIIALVSWTARS